MKYLIFKFVNCKLMFVAFRPGWLRYYIFLQTSISRGLEELGGIDQAFPTRPGLTDPPVMMRKA